MPKLKVLSLGRFVFSHLWQIDWFASLELEQLYLHDYAILYKFAVPLSTSMTFTAGHVRERDIFSGQSGHNEKDPGDVFPGHILWHTILSHWRKSMLKLKIFKASYGPKIRQAGRDPRDPFLCKSTQRANAFRNFDYPLQDTSSQRLSEHGTCKSKTAHGDQLAYVYYENLDRGTEFASHMKTKNASLEIVSEKYINSSLFSKDEAALSLLECTVEARRTRTVL